MNNFADRLVASISVRGNPCVIGLDPRIDMIPDFIGSQWRKADLEKALRRTIRDFHEIVLDTVKTLVPAVKLQIAFYEQYGLPGMEAFVDTIQLAKERDLIVIVDAKRNDIASTAEAYANAFLGRSNIFGCKKAFFDVDCLTVSPFLGRDSIEPFVARCKEYGKGIFILVKTSNPGSVDVQDQNLVNSGKPLYEYLARMVDDLGSKMVGSSGYSSIGAVVGATFPTEAALLRELMPQAIILVPGYGAQGGTAQDAVRCFNPDGLGAVINASRSITYGFDSLDISANDFVEIIRKRTVEMIHDVKTALELRRQS